MRGCPVVLRSAFSCHSKCAYIGVLEESNGLSAVVRGLRAVLFEQLNTYLASVVIIELKLHKTLDLQDDTIYQFKRDL